MAVHFYVSIVGLIWLMTMNDDEQAQAVLEGLAGIRYCSRCHKPAPLPHGLTASRLLDPPGGPFLCPRCWLDNRNVNSTETWEEVRAAYD